MFENSEIIKSHQSVWKNNKEIATCTYYQKLSFQYTFKEEDANSAVYFCYARPYSYTNLQQDLECARRSLMTKRSDDEEAPRFKALSKKDYMDYDKFKHFHESNLDDTVALSPILPGSMDEQNDEQDPQGRRRLQKKKTSMKVGNKEDSK